LGWAGKYTAEKRIRLRNRFLEERVKKAKAASKGVNTGQRLFGENLG